MSNPLDSLIETLKTAEPRAEAIDRAADALRPHPSFRPRLIPLAAGVAVLSLVALWPRGGSGVAWAQIAAQKPPLRYTLQVDRVIAGKSKRLYETKVDSVTGSFRASHMSPTGAVEAERRKDGYFWPLDTEWITGPFGHYARWRGVASYSHKPYKGHLFEGWGRELDLNRLLNEKGNRQLGVDREMDTRVGKANRYRLEQPTSKGQRAIPLEVYVKPGTTQILGWDAHGEPGAVFETTITYPDHFDASDWAFPVKPGVPTFDLDVLDAWAKAQVKHPLATLKAGGATSQLQFAVQGVRHEIWFVWKGPKPNGDLKDRVQVLGMKNGISYGIAGFANKPGEPSNTAFGGHAVQLDRKVDFVDLRVPVFTKDRDRSKLAGYATVRHIPVKQVPEFGAIWGALDIHRPMR